MGGSFHSSHNLNFPTQMRQGLLDYPIKDLMMRPITGASRMSDRDIAETILRKWISFHGQDVAVDSVYAELWEELTWRLRQSSTGAALAALSQMQAVLDKKGIPAVPDWQAEVKHALDRRMEANDKGPLPDNICAFLLLIAAEKGRKENAEV